MPKLHLPVIGALALLQLWPVQARGEPRPKGTQRATPRGTSPSNARIHPSRPPPRTSSSEPRRLRRPWKSEHRVQVPREYTGSVVEISSRFQAGRNASGSLWSQYLKKPRTWVIESAYAGDLPATTREGTASWTMLAAQMRHLGVKLDELRSLRLADINNVQTVLRIYEHGDSVDARSLPVARGMIRALERAGARVSRVTLSRSYEHRPHEIGKLMEPVESAAEARGGKEAREVLEARHNRMLQRLGLKRTSEVPIRWDIEIYLGDR